jgi:hypothetical protein
MPFEKGCVPVARGPKRSQTHETKIRGKNGGTVEVTLSRSQAIKAMCTECCGFGECHPKDCTDVLCPLYPFRGKIQLAYQDGSEVPVEEDAEGAGEDEA